ncbi:hypothetical protein FBU31_001260 [Coemansia sp. 'formosensis']|nr:hypothetical protein FBU31_001260 [Coemansia sp. 'formosensis']
MFYFSLPVGTITGIIIVVFLCLPRPCGSFREKLRRVDFIGMVVLVTDIIMVLLALSFGSKDYVWSSLMVLCLLIFGIVIVGTFVVIEWKIPAEPIMPLHLFRNRNVGLMLIMQLFVGTVIFSLTFCIPMYFSVVHNSSAISAGLHLLPYIQPISIFSTISGFVVAKTGCYPELLWVGRSINTIATRLFVLLDESTSMGKSIGLTIVGGTGMGLLLQPMLLVLQTAIQPRDMAMGTTLFVAICTLSSSIGLAVFQTVQQNKLGSIISKLKLQYPHSQNNGASGTTAIPTVPKAEHLDESDAPQLEEQFILRVLPNIATHFEYLASLPTISESYCTLDKSQMLMTTNICHMLLVKCLLIWCEDLALVLLARGLDVIYPDVLSLTLANMRRTRFRHRIPNTKVESIEREVLCSLEEDVQAVTVKLEAIDIK